MDSRVSSGPPTDDARLTAGSTPRVLITAGPTHEPIDRVRYIGNRSSGKMGVALARACNARGWPVTLLLGPVEVPASLDTRISLLRFQTAAELQRLLHEHWPAHDVLFMAAAVADFTVRQPSDHKIKRRERSLTLELEPTPDLLAGLASLTTPRQTVVGFALESANDLEREAHRKLKAKRVDAIVANPLETMDAAEVTATVMFADGSADAAQPNLAKGEFADWLISLIAPIAQRRLAQCVPDRVRCIEPSRGGIEKTDQCARNR